MTCPSCKYLFFQYSHTFPVTANTDQKEVPEHVKDSGAYTNLMPASINQGPGRTVDRTQDAEVKEVSVNYSRGPNKQTGPNYYAGWQIGQKY